jgi:hypothetical protein
VIVRYANDLEVTELARQIRNEERSMQASLTDGNRDGAFNRAEEMINKLIKLQERLNRIKYAVG